MTGRRRGASFPLVPTTACLDAADFNAGIRKAVHYAGRDPDNPAPRPAAPYRLHSTYERLLGTEVEVQVVARTAAQAEAAEQAALTEIDRLTRIFNRFDPGSELCRWQARPGDAHVPLSLELLHLLRLADHWRTLSGGAFHPGADAMGQLWQQAAATGQQPSAATLERQVSALRAAPWTLHADGSATLHAAGPLGLNALAKGYVVDRAALVASRCVGSAAS